MMAAVFLFIALLCITGCSKNSEGLNQRIQGTEVPAKENEVANLYTQIIDSQRELEDRIDTAAQLARHEDAGPWLVLALMNVYGSSLPSYDATGHRDLEKIGFGLTAEQYKYRPILASLLANIPANADNAVLWAVTYSLTDPNRATYGVTQWLGLAHHHVASEPIRDLARHALVDAIKEDHGYDETAWRKDILSRIERGD